MGGPQIAYNGPTELDVLKLVAQQIIDYVNWYAENGYFLPPGFERDPAGWTQILRDIEAAMKVILVLPETMPDDEYKLLYDRLEKYYTYSRYLFKP